VTTKSDDVMT